MWARAEKRNSNGSNCIWNKIVIVVDLYPKKFDEYTNAIELNMKKKNTGERKKNQIKNRRFFEIETKHFY